MDVRVAPRALELAHEQAHEHYFPDAMCFRPLLDGAERVDGGAGRVDAKAGRAVSRDELAYRQV